MSHLTSLSIKDKHRPQYLALRDWLNQKNMGIGDYLIEKFTQEFSQDMDLPSEREVV
jgi:hypothetical protein